MTHTQNRAWKFMYFVLGIALPVAAYAFCSKSDVFSCRKRKSRVDQAHDITVEDSFPASDPPSAW